MPYSSEHKLETRTRIVRNARKLFNTHGFSEVSIDQIMASAGLTRGGFYNHFRNKDELYVEAMDRYSADRMEEMSGEPMPCGPETALQIVKAYVSQQELDDLEGQCPLIALPSDGPAPTRPYEPPISGCSKDWLACSRAIWRLRQARWLPGSRPLHLRRPVSVQWYWPAQSRM